MKKLFLTSAMIGMFVIPTYATTLTGTGTECTQPILNTDTGPATLQAQWNANTINLNWYSDDTQITVPTASNTCTYDGGITLPTTNPTKEGYTFGGWRVRQLFNLSTLNANTNALSNASHGATDYCYYYYYNESTDEEVEVDDDCSDSHVSDLSASEWKTEFSYGTVKGIARCSTQHPITPWYHNNNTFTSDHFAQSLTDETGQAGAQYCWCQPTGFAEPNSSSYSSVASPSWVFNRDYGNAGGCARNCAGRCAGYVQDASGFRQAIYGITQ